MSEVSSISRSSKPVIGLQAAETSHRDNAKCDPELFKAYLTHKMTNAVKNLTPKEKKLSQLIEKLLEDDLEKAKEERDKLGNDEDSSMMGSVKLACLSELNELISLGYLPDDDVEKEADDEQKLVNPSKEDLDAKKRKFDPVQLKQKLYEHHSAYTELNSILDELNQKLSSALYMSHEING
ncbi:hypothetical protein JQC92_00565 [Shewanella sp. 202IG2-18]|uniref:hypothetical protein n=1 Tax=Parashewanella hymeniacidonis TaxID=2807618 RepID=UPI00195FD426|nr:hypothetical protein [Parashewanella hymeniacidonis]MBM7070538.1 hypothetical protein [Parashewanella hymeniacidonis]